MKIALRPSVRVALAALLVVALAGCSALPASRVPYSGDATVVSVREVREAGTAASIVGTALGAALGGTLGASIGGGTGQVLAASVMSVITATIGAEAAKRAGLGERTRYEVLVRSEDGIDRAFTMPDAEGLRTGTKVRVREDRLER